jgi:glutamine amidotransferase
MITIIDYGMGNLRSVAKGFEKVGFPARLTSDKNVVKDAGKIVLPGVGAFGDCMKNLEKFDLIGVIKDHINSGKPYLGLCLGLQVLFTESEEFALTKGLDIIKGRVVKFPEDEFKKKGLKLKIPHMGWNSVSIKKETPILKGIANGTYFYFVHSYYVKPDDESAAATKTGYGIEFTSMVSRENVFACQFHPEKSQAEGLKILKNFGEL